MLMGSLVRKETQRGEHALAGRLPADPAVVRGNAIGGEAETRGGHASDALLPLLLLVFAIIQCAVKRQAGPRIGLVPKIPEGAPRNIVDQIRIELGEGMRRETGRLPVRSPDRGRQHQPAGHCGTGDAQKSAKIEGATTRNAKVLHANTNTPNSLHPTRGNSL